MVSPVGVISGIERFSIHDGPGIRTLIFMKGCPLRCLWCSSPQTQKNVPELLYDVTQCMKCKKCFETCPSQAISFSPETGVSVDTTLCDCCGKCAENCPAKALELIGKKVNPDELFKEVSRDSAFFRRSKGGVTVGGGEPTLQADFVAQFLALCKRRFFHTAIETCGYCQQAKLDRLLEHLDLVYMDIKHMNDMRHRELTGVSNHLLLKNAESVAQVRPLILRVPVIPGCNDNIDNIKATAEFAYSLGKNLLMIELLPYHKLGIHTYIRMGRDYLLRDVEPPNQEQMDQFKQTVERFGVKVQAKGI